MHSSNSLKLIQNNTSKFKRTVLVSLVALLFCVFSAHSDRVAAAEEAEKADAADTEDTDPVQFIAPDATPVTTTDTDINVADDLDNTAMDTADVIEETPLADTTPPPTIEETDPAKPAEDAVGDGGEGEEPVGDDKDKPAEGGKDDNDKEKPVAAPVAEGTKPAATETDTNAGVKAEDKTEVEAPIPPPPVPTPEELAKREKRSEDFKTLGEKAFGFPVTGSLSTRYRIRGGESEQDQDIYEFLSLDVGGKNNFASGHIDARLAADLDGQKTGVKSDLFSNVLDTYDNAIDTRLYSAYVDFNKVPGLEFLRAGRQWLYETPEILNFDGVRVDTDPFFGKHEVKFSFYGGVPVHQYEYDNHGNSVFGDDDLAGTSVEGRPIESMRLRLDFVHIDDNATDTKTSSTDPVLQTLSPSHGTLHNNLYTASVWQTFKNPDVRVQGSFTAIDDHARDAMARVLYNKNDWRLQVAATYKVWFEQEARRVLEFDRFFDTLSGQEPYNTGSLIVSKGWTDHFWTESGGIFRRLLDSGNEGLFNREFNRYYTTFQIRDLPIKGLSASVTGSRWEGLGHAPTSNEVGADVTYKWKKEFLSSIGSEYALYKYDLFQNKERDQVHTYYVKQRWRPTPWATLDVKYEHERSRTDQFNTLTATFRFDF